MSIYDIFVIVFIGTSAVGHVFNMYKLRCIGRQNKEPARRVFLPASLEKELEKKDTNVIQIHIPKAVAKVINCD